MTETVFEKLAAAVSVLKLDFSSEEFAVYAEEHELSEAEIAAVEGVFTHLSEKKQQTTVHTLLRMSRLPTKSPRTFENFDFSLLKGRDVERLKALPSLSAIYSHRNLAFIGPAGTGKTHLAQAFGYDGSEYNAACFAMICHHCGQRYVEFFPNAKQENLFIGMIHAFRYMGVPQYVLTDNMKSVVIRRDLDGNPIWQKDYEQFMKTVGFQTKLCKPRHPFTKGKGERLVGFVKENFLVGRVFWNVTDLNYAALDWCNEQNAAYHRGIGIPQDIHSERCLKVVSILDDSYELLFYLCPERRISFDGFVSYEGRRFGVPYTYHGKTARVLRDGDTLYIYSSDMAFLLTTHNVTWVRRDSFCENQYALPEQPEEFPTMPVKTVIKQLPEPVRDLSFEKFNFSKEDGWDE